MAKIISALWTILLLGLLGSVTPALASPDVVKWSRVNIPTEGKAGNWVLASGSDVQHLTMAIDGSLYAYASPSGTSYTLFKSTDDGYSWSHVGRVTDDIVDIATAPDDASLVYYATGSGIYKSIDAAGEFDPLPLNPGGAGSNNIEITSIDVARLESNYIVAVGTRDTDGSQYGGVYTLDEAHVLSAWQDTNLGDGDVYAVAFSPRFTSDRQLVAVVSDETDIFVTFKIGDGGWAEIAGDTIIPVTSVATADTAFPDDYDATTEEYALFVAIDTGNDNGDVYKVYHVAAPDSSVATDLDVGSAYGLSNIDVAALDTSGETTTANLVAGAAGSAQVYFSRDGGTNWVKSTKGPTGESITCVLMAPDFTSRGRAYAATGGAESALSITEDGGITWNQAGLIDTTIGTGNILDLAISPSYSQDNALFMLTFGGEHSLWRSLSGGTRWERVFSSTLAYVDTIKLVELSPRYGSGSQVVFLAGVSNGNPATWRSTDNGQIFGRRNAPLSIDAWAVVNDDTLFVSGFDATDNQALVYYSTNGGWTYSTTGAVAGSQPLKSIVLSPSYEQDKTILAGNTDGWVYWSSDNGTSFEPVPPDATSPPLTGEITVAFDHQFSSNHIIYAASDNADKGIYRFTINKDTEWESIDGTFPSGGKVSQLMVSSNGTLYATNLKADGGMERCLNPTYPLGPTFETVTRGLEDSVTLYGLWVYDNQLWSIDTANTRLMTFTDSLAVPVILTSPPDQATGIDIKNVKLDWETLSGAIKYEWQLDYDTDFSNVLDQFKGEPEASSSRLPELELATTYYWRVRAIDPVLSPWSAKGSFITMLGTETTIYIIPELYSPGAGAGGVPLKPVFQWSAIAGADSYELLVSTDASLANPVITKIGDYALPSTAWQCNVNLNHNTTYYWKVRAIGSETSSTWSSVGAFTTELPPVLEPSPKPAPPPAEPPPELAAPSSPKPAPPPPPPTPPKPSAPPVQQTTPEWTIYLIGALVLTIILLLIIVLVLVVGTRRL